MSKGLVLGNNISYSLNCKKTKVNNNVLVVGAAGSGKTRGLVEPNILQTSGSYIITDPKGNLHRKYKDYLEARGYYVGKVDFVHPENSMHYNCFSFIRKEEDIHSIAHVLVWDEGVTVSGEFAFWNAAAENLLESILALLWETGHEINFRSICNMLTAIQIEENNPGFKSKFDMIMEAQGKRNRESYAYRQYCKFRCGAGKTMKSIVITLTGKLGKYESEELAKMFSRNDCDFTRIGTRKEALFVVVSDHDRSNDILVDLFFTQAMSELVKYADDCCTNGELPVPVRFIMDDFATNCRIADFPRMISSIRSRRISVMLILQAESQLTHYYKEDGNTIISNCDTYLYLGGNDIDTASNIARRLNVPLAEVLYMPVGHLWIFRRGQQPMEIEIIDLDEYAEYREYQKFTFSSISYVNEQAS